MRTLFRNATEDEVGILTAMSKAAFLSDIEYCGEPGGPTGYDDYDFHLGHQNNGDLYSLLDNGKIVAGAILAADGDSLYIYRIFVNPEEFHKGYGIKLMKEIEDHFPEVMLFKLDTPEWNSRTNSFYQKCGYKAVGKEHIPEFDLIVYKEKRSQLKLR